MALAAKNSGSPSYIYMQGCLYKHRGFLLWSAEKFGWKDKWKGWEVPTRVSPDGKRAVGVGVGVHGNADIGEDPTEAFVKLHPFGSITVECCIGESGGAQRHAAQKMAAEVMNVLFDGVQVVAADTHGTPYDAGLIGSRGTITIGTAVVRATKDARRKLLYALEGTDVGQIIDSTSLKMQAEGSFGAAGADTALFEEIIIDKHNGHIMNGNMIDYKWRTFNEFPPFDFVALESKFDTEAFHALGFGEISGSPAPSAILMAISNAIGREVTHYPATPDVVLRAMGKIK